jgi:peptide/nickel transport system substrate-binding protein
MGPAPEQHPGSRLRLRSRRMLAVSAVAAALSLAAVGCASSSTTPTSSDAAIIGGTATWAEQPSTPPNYIFPFENSNYISVANSDEFAMLMYRPLYWFGTGTQPTVNTALSLANLPVWSGNTATITMKPWRWSNGTPITAQNVVFWLNMLQAVGASDWGVFTGFPNTEVTSYKAVNASTLTITTNKAYSHTWFLYNDLSQVTPMPTAWDRTASGPSNCAKVVADCTAVYNYLNDQSKDMTSYVGSPLWSIVDGPWTLSSFNADGKVTFVPNKSYSGPVKAKLAKFEEVPFTTNSAEYGALRSSGSTSKIDVGYAPTENLPAKPAGATVGANPLSSRGYSLYPQPVWGINYYLVNFQSTTGNGPILNQLYFRDALAYLMNQQAVLDGPLRGYGSLTVGPVANSPVSQYLSPQGKKGDPFPFNPAKAKSLLTSHGWNVVPGGLSTCKTPSLCGHGVKRGQALDFNFPYVKDVAFLAWELTRLRSSALALGIHLNLKPEPFGTLLELTGANCKVAGISCDWDLADWGGGWSFAPDYLPTGETLFMCGAIANSGGYCDKTNDALIEQTLTSNNVQYLYQWQDYLATKLPVMWQPNADQAVWEIADDLHGVTPLSPTLTLTPEYWYFAKPTAG